jgi:alpha-galactosidase
LEGLAKEINDLNMEFGLWVEPEAICPDSELYRKHPDWCLHVKGRYRSEGRNELLLDLSRDDVCDAVSDMICDVLKSANIRYVKWDLNRYMTEIGSAALPPERQRETAHRYVLGLYKIMETLIQKFPHILFEGCASGGGRFDPGILYYMPQFWASDNTDAIERLRIQHGTSIVYPIISITSHVSAVPNHQLRRVTPLKTRGAVAMAANFGYELDLTKLSKEEKEEIKEQVIFYKEIRQLVQFGDFYRLLSPFEGNKTAWMIVSKDKEEFVVFFYRMLAESIAPFGRLKLNGIDPNGCYKLVDSGEIYYGDELMHAGILIGEKQNDFESIVWRFKRVNDH